MDPLQENDALQQFMKLLAENGREGQAADLSQLMWYMDGMTRQYESVLRELQEVRQQLAQVQETPQKNLIGRMVDALESKVQQVRSALDSLWTKISRCAAEAVENVAEAGVSALDKATNMALQGTKSALEGVRKTICGAYEDVKRDIEKVEEMGHELRSVGGHLKNAGRALTGKETQRVDGGQEGRFQSAVLAPMRATQKLLVGMNNATLAAIGRVEELERPVEERNQDLHRASHGQAPGKRLAKKPSIRQELASHRAATARAAPVPEREKTPEAAL